MKVSLKKSRGTEENSATMGEVKIRIISEACCVVEKWHSHRGR